MSRKPSFKSKFDSRTSLEAGCTSKVKHANEMMARMAAKKLLYRNSRGQTAAWVYPCEFCDGWHVTSRPSGLPRVTL